jgi:hypothetical protein
MNRPATYSARHGDSMACDGSENALLALNCCATRGMAVRDMMLAGCCCQVCLELEHLELRAHRPLRDTRWASSLTAGHHGCISFSDELELIIYAEKA